MPAPNKQSRSKVEVLDWYSEYDPAVEERASKRMKQTHEVDVLNWDQIMYKIDTNELCFETHKSNMHMYQYILHSYFIICVYM